MRSFRFRTALLVLLSAVLQVVVFPVAGPLPAWRASLSWLAFVPLLWSLLDPGRTGGWRRAALIGYACGVLWYTGTCYWVYATMHVYGGLSAPMSLLTLLLFSLYLALYHAAFAVLLESARRVALPFALAAAPFLWVAVELARARVTSFPWNLLGYAQIDNAALTALAPFTGAYGISFLLFLGNVCIASALLMPGRRRPAAVALGAAVLAAGLQNAGALLRSPLRVGQHKAVLLQPNLAAGVGESLDPAALAASSASLSLQAASLTPAPTSLVLWPESPSPYQTDRTAFTSTAAVLAKQVEAPVIAGAVGVETSLTARHGAMFFNSAALFTPQQGYVTRYDKIHLVPFGEYVPYKSLLGFAGGLTQAVGTSERGTSRMPLTAGGHHYGVFLCYESIFGDEVRQFAVSGAEVFVNLSDDGWYGDSSAPFQHLNMARMRAIENHRWLLRDTNSGITASIDPEGRVVETMQRHVRGAVAVHFDYLQGTTFYTRNGDLFAYACAVFSAAALGYALTKRQRNAVD